MADKLSKSNVYLETHYEPGDPGDLEDPGDPKDAGGGLELPDDYPAWWMKNRVWIPWIVIFVDGHLNKPAI